MLRSHMQTVKTMCDPPATEIQTSVQVKETKVRVMSNITKETAHITSLNSVSI